MTIRRPFVYGGALFGVVFVASTITVAQSGEQRPELSQRSQDVLLITPPLLGLQFDRACVVLNAGSEPVTVSASLFDLDGSPLQTIPSPLNFVHTCSSPIMLPAGETCMSYFHLGAVGEVSGAYCKIVVSGPKASKAVKKVRGVLVQFGPEAGLTLEVKNLVEAR